ncbi:MAG TPA: cytochrome P450 [Nitriliruptoraceae bacterium]|nr:cytochrome P450 [Nitriliruptoraceae bacterium]
MSLMEVAQGAVRDKVRLVAFRILQRRDDVMGQLFDPVNRDDPYRLYDEIRAQGPVSMGPINAMTVSHEVANQVFRHPATRTGTAARNDLADANALQRWLFRAPDRGDLVDPLGAESMIGLDGSEHARLRRLVSAEFTPSSIALMRPRLETVAARLVDDLPRDGFDLMDAFANVFPVLAICEVLGIPEDDHRQFRAWGSALAADLDAIVPAPKQRAATKALAELTAYLDTLVAHRRRDPGDDLLSRLAVLEQDGDQLTDRELLSTCMLLLVAGFETTTNLIGNGMLALLDNRDQLDWLRDDLTRTPNAVEELLRYDSPVQLSSRFVGEPLPVSDGSTLPVGDPLVIFLGGANRDPDVFADPNQLDLGRPEARRHLAFASGPHYCLGAALARLEGEIAFTTLLDRLDDVRLAGPPVRRPTFVLRGLESLPLAAT